MEISTVPSTSSSFSIAPRFLSVIVFLLMFTSIGLAQNGTDKKGERDKEAQQNNWRKVTVCHDGNALEIDESALQAHLNHGDAVGPCSQVSYTGTVTSYLEEVGKTQEPIGTELKILEESFAANGSATSDEIFVISKSKLVLIEIVVQRGKKQNVLAFLNSTYNITEFTTSGPDDLLILVLFPIDKVSELNSNADIRFVRPVYKPLTNSGVVTSLGDVAQRSDNARQAFGVTGNGITVGVLSDSYNTKNLASKDYQNGDLPGPENPNGNLTPVNVLKEYPLETIGSRFSTVDEGRAMLQIVHDVAPKASLAFRTGVLSPSDMAQGILDLQAIAGCNVIVDDVTHYKEPFYQDGVIARAVNQVTAAGVQYFTSAGNFGRNSYQAQFNPSNNSSNHDFNLGSGVDELQNVRLGVGFFRIVLQWNDDYYTLPGATNNGALIDLDIFLISNEGDTLVNQNTNNLGKDPIEIMTFSVGEGFASANISIHRAAGNANVDFKYIVFEGKDFGFNEHAAGSSTIMGHANAAGAMTVGAVLYTNTPAYNTTPSIASFSSQGGLTVNGANRNKPDFVAPNGANTTVNLGGANIDTDLYPNFFGTSASAPHAAGVAALLLEAKTKFGVSFTLRQLLQQTAINMETPGFDNASGFGLIQADAAILTFAAPIPTVTSLVVPPGATPGTAPFNLTVRGKNLDANSKVLLNGSQLTTTFVNSRELVASIPVFSNDPPIQVRTLPRTQSGNDGGLSNALYLFRAPKKVIEITADNKTKRFGERLPQFTASIKIDGVPMDSTSTLAALGLSNLQFNSTATSLSGVGQYLITPVNAVSDSSFLEQFDYTLINGTLVIEKMPLEIIPEDLTQTYGEKISGLSFIYNYDKTNIDSLDDVAILNLIQQSHTSTFIDVDSIALINRTRGIVNDGDLINRTRGIVNGTGWLVTPTTLNRTRGIVNDGDDLINRTRGIVNQLYLDIPDESFDNYLVDPTDAYTNRTRGIVNAGAMANGDATINRTRGIVNDQGELINRTRGIVNDGALVNSDGGVVGFEDLILVVDSLDYAVSDLYSINVISGIDVTPEEYQQFIVPGAFFALEAEFFEITYGLGNLTILPATLTAVQGDYTIMDGDSLPAFTSVITGFVYDENDSSVFSSITYEPTSYSGVGSYPIVPSFEFRDWENYVFNTITPGTLSVIGLGTNGRIAFARYNEFSTLEIGVVNSDGTVPVSVVVGDGSESIRDPQFSPDGNQISFTLSPRDVRGPESIWKINVDGSGLTQLSTDTLNHSSSFSPDGRKIGYIKNNEIAIMNSDGTGTSILTSSNTSNPPYISKRWTDFSPVGEKIIYVQSELDIFIDRFNSIWQVDVNTQIANRVTPEGDSLYYRSPVFLKDGSKIIYVRTSRFGQGPPAIMSMNPDGTGQTELFISNELPVDVAVSPDNTKLTFALFDGDDGGYNLFTMNLDGSDVTEIHSEAGLLWWPSWGTNPDLQGADLSVSAISIEKSIITFEAEPPTYINYTVANSGTEPITGPVEADLFNVIYNGDPVTKSEKFIVLDSGVVLLPGESLNHQFAVGHQNDWPVGDYSLRIRVDGNNNVAEVAESNNLSAIVTFKVVTNGRIAFARYNDTFNLEIGLVNSDGTVPVSLVVGDGSKTIRDPEFSPDGNQIAFTLDPQGLAGSIWKINVDGTGLVELTTDALNHSPSFSPNGNRIGFVKNNEIAIMNSDGTETSVLTSTGGNKRWTDFSPDGQRIMYVEPWNGTPNSIWQVDINTGNTFVVSPEGNNRYRSPIFLKDGSKIISVRSGQGSQEIISMNPDGTEVTVLFSSNQLPVDVAVSPDNTKLAFALFDESDQGNNLYIMNLDGSNVTEIHSEAGLLWWPSWGTNPDLIGTDIWISKISIENPEVVFEKEPWTNVNFTVANSGNAPIEGPIQADLFTVLYNGDSLALSEVFVVLDSGVVLLPGESVELQFPVGHTNEWTPGSYSLRVRVDGNNNLAEVAENNNLSAIINFEVKTPAADLWMLNSTLIAYDSANNLVLEQSGYSGNQTISGVRHVEVSQQGDYAWLAELGPPYRLLKVSASGATLNADTTRQYGAIDLASDETVYALESTGSISGGDVYILNSDGVQLLSAAYGGIDIVVDETNNAVWIVGDDINMLDMNLNHVFTIDPFAWSATSVDFDVSGNAWIGEGRHSQVPFSVDQLMKVSPNGSILDTIPTLSGRPTTVRVNKTDGRVWYTNGVSLIYYSPDDQSHEIAGNGGFTFDIDYANGVIWTYSTSEVLKYNFYGTLITAIPNNNVGGQLYLGAKSSTQGWEAPSQGFGGSSLTQGDITVYPNPVIDYMEVVHANGNIPIENISILLYDNSGVPVTSSISSLPSQVNHGLVVDMTALQPGFYFLHVNDNITTEVFRIQKN